MRAQQKLIKILHNGMIASIFRQNTYTQNLHRCSRQADPVYRTCMRARLACVEDTRAAASLRVKRVNEMVSIIHAQVYYAR